MQMLNFSEFERPDDVAVTCVCGVTGLEFAAFAARWRCRDCAVREDQFNRVQSADNHRRAAEEARVQAWIAQVPPRHRDCQFRVTLRTRIAATKSNVDAVARVAALPFGRSITILGCPGAGKTSLAAALWRLLETQGRIGVWSSAFALSRARHAWPIGQGEAPLVLAACESDLLCVDDLGQEPKIESSAIPDIVFARHESDAPTWITTGLTKEEIAGRYGGGVARRIFEDAECIRLGAA
jgi:DNA replication protein DnaC